MNHPTKISPAGQYVCLVEHNDWEGETWHFFIPVEGNQQQLQKLYAALSEHNLLDEDDGYELDLDEWHNEVEVDAAVLHAHDGYMASHNKLQGTIDIDKLRPQLRTEDTLILLLNKGNIVDKDLGLSYAAPIPTIQNFIDGVLANPAASLELHICPTRHGTTCVDLEVKSGIGNGKSVSIEHRVRDTAVNEACKQMGDYFAEDA